MHEAFILVRRDQALLERVVDIDSGHLVGIVTLDDLLLGSAETVDQVIRVLSQERLPDGAVIDILSRRQIG